MPQPPHSRLDCGSQAVKHPFTSPPGRRAVSRAVTVPRIHRIRTKSIALRVFACPGSASTTCSRQDSLRRSTRSNANGRNPSKSEAQGRVGRVGLAATGYAAERSSTLRPVREFSSPRGAACKRLLARLTPAFGSCRASLQSLLDSLGSSCL